MQNNSYTVAIIVGIIVIIAIVGAYAFFSNQGTPSTQTPTTSVPQETTPTTTTPTTSVTPGNTGTQGVQAQVKTFTLVANDYSFTPSEIRVKKGDTVKIILQNTGGSHDWVVDEFSARTKTISGGQTDQVEFTADKTGTFEFYCSVANHRQMGMKGNLIIE